MKIETEKLYQWDLGRTIKIITDDGEVIDEVNFYDPGGLVAIVVEAKVTEGGYIANIPNILLTYPVDIELYVMKDNHTKMNYFVEVEPRQKPSDYVYTETEVLSYKALEKRIKEVEENGVSSETVAQAVEKYLKENPIESGVTEERVAEVVNEALAQAKASGKFDGKDGLNGKDGQDGYTPIKGTDYFTQADKQEIINDIFNQVVNGSEVAY